MSKRRNFMVEQKLAIVREHLLEGVTVSDLCDKYEIHPTQYYAWQKTLFENGAAAFARKPNAANARRKQDAQQKKIEELEAKIHPRNSRPSR